MKPLIILTIFLVLICMIYVIYTNIYKKSYKTYNEEYEEYEDNMAVIKAISNEKVNANKLPILINLYLTFETGVLVKALHKWNFDITIISHGTGKSIDMKTVNELEKLGVKVIYNPDWTLEELSKVRKEFIQKNGMNYKILLDEGAELYYDYLDLGMENVLANILLITEQTSWGVYRLKKLNYLPKEVYSVSDSVLKLRADNYLSVSEGIFSTIIQYGGKLISGSTIFIVGYGPVGSGIADRAKLLGAKTIVAEIDPVRAYLAFLNGHSVMKNEDAVKISDIIITATGSENVISSYDVIQSKKGCLFLNAGHGDKEITFPKEYKSFIQKNSEVSILPDQKRLLAQGKVANIYLMGGNPPQTMDLSFSLQLLLIKDSIDINNINNINKSNIKPINSNNTIQNIQNIQKIPYSIEQSIANILCSTYRLSLNF